MLPLCSNLSSREWVLPIDSEKLWVIHLSYDPLKKEFTFCPTVKIQLKIQHDTLFKTLSAGLKILQSGYPTIQASIALGSHVLHQIVYHAETGSTTLLFSHPLVSHDLRVLNQQGLISVDKIAQRHLQPALKAFPADLHTHFGGVITIKMFKKAFKLAKQQSIPILFPKKDLREMRVFFTSPSTDSLMDLSNPEVKFDELKFFQSLALDPFGVTSFNDMENVYRFRGPIVKNLQLFPIFLELIAKDYQKYGVQYAELSLSDILKPEWMKVALENLPQIEKKYQVSLRFLVGLWRHSPNEFNQDLIEQIKTYVNSGNPYIVGADYMGQETNSTRDFIKELQMLAQIKTIFPNFVIRVHAGESLCHPKNVYLAIKEGGATRIGHGLYGLDEETLILAKEKDVIFECNPTSNHTLNNTPTEEESTIKKLLDAGIRVTVGTDGYGCYRTNPLLEASLVKQRGLTEQDLKFIEESDLAYIKKMTSSRIPLDTMAIDRYLPSLPKAKAPANIWTLAEERKVKAKEEIVALVNQQKMTYVNYHQLPDFFKKQDLLPLLFAGGTSTSWDEPVSEQDKIALQSQIKDFMSHLNEKKVALMTGGTDFGLEKLVHLAVAEFKKVGKNFILLGTLASQLQADASTISSSLTHATVIDGSWYDLAPQVLTAVAQSRGKAFFMTGGDVVKEMIQISKNLSENLTLLNPFIDYYLLKDVIGSPMTMTKIILNHDFSKNDRLASLVFKKSPEIFSSLLLNWEEAIHYLNGISKKKFVTFLGYSSEYANPENLTKQIKRALSDFDPKSDLIMAGATVQGIGSVYPIAKEMGFETAGIVSSLAHHSQNISPFADFVFYILSEQWGGYQSLNGEETQQPLLDPVSKVIVRTTHLAIRLDGGKIAKIEAKELKKLGKTVFKIKDLP